jgi:hypothetical protein
VGVSERIDEARRNQTMLKRKLLIGALALGTVDGYAAGFASLARHAGSCHSHRRAQLEERVAEVCTRAAHRVIEDHRQTGPTE